MTRMLDLARLQKRRSGEHNRRQCPVKTVNVNSRIALQKTNRRADIALCAGRQRRPRAALVDLSFSFS